MPSQTQLQLVKGYADEMSHTTSNLEKQKSSHLDHEMKTDTQAEF